MDGSALPYMTVLQKTGALRQSALRRAILIKKPVVIAEQDKYACFIPSPTPWINLEIDFPSEAIGKQQISLPINQKTFLDQLAPARTFGFEDQINTLRSLGLAKGGSLRNAVLIKDDKVMNEDGLRYPDEFVRHKALDCIGDMALAGARIAGLFKGRRTGHQINNALLRELMVREDAWEYTTLANAQAYWDRMSDSSGFDALRDAPRIGSEPLGLQG
jgi:UDP-3-O-[3-hydroxymyristoyl] N-acetylglucosamine deacetylase